MAQTARRHPGIRHPERFTQDQVGWAPWLEPLAEEDLTDAHREGLTDLARAKSPYFRLLVRDPAALRARTLVDRDIFTNEDGGLPLAERELAAAAASRSNGCVYCASVHARNASRLSGRVEDVQAVLDEGEAARVGERWDAVAAAAVALTATPSAFGAGEIARLRAAGLAEDEIADVVNSAAFFNWANRLMLSLGEPEVVAPLS